MAPLRVDPVVELAQPHRPPWPGPFETSARRQKKVKFGEVRIAVPRLFESTGT